MALFLWWVNATATGMSLLRNSDALSGVTPWHLVIERYEKQNQDFELNLEDTHPPIVGPSTPRDYATPGRASLLRGTLRVHDLIPPASKVQHE